MPPEHGWDMVSARLAPSARRGGGVDLWCFGTSSGGDELEEDLALVDGVHALVYLVHHAPGRCCHILQSARRRI